MATKRLTNKPEETFSLNNYADNDSNIVFKERTAKQ